MPFPKTNLGMRWYVFVLEPSSVSAYSVIRLDKIILFLTKYLNGATPQVFYGFLRRCQ